MSQSTQQSIHQVHLGQMPDSALPPVNGYTLTEQLYVGHHTTVYRAIATTLDRTATEDVSGGTAPEKATGEVAAARLSS